MQTDRPSGRELGSRTKAGRSARQPADLADVTELLRAWRHGDEDAFSRLLPLVYDELRRQARRYLGAEARGHLLQPTALVHELYCRLAGSPPEVDWEDRRHFFAVAARAMRQILVDHARTRARTKRGGGLAALSLGGVGEVAIAQPHALVELDDALTALAAVDPFKASLVELRFFAGLTGEEASQALACSTATVTRQWRAARAWLYRELARDGE